MVLDGPEYGVGVEETQCVVQRFHNLKKGFPLLALGQCPRDLWLAGRRLRRNRNDASTSDDVFDDCDGFRRRRRGHAVQSGFENDLNAPIELSIRLVPDIRDRPETLLLAIASADADELCQRLARHILTASAPSSFDPIGRSESNLELRLTDSQDAA